MPHLYITYDGSNPPKGRVYVKSDGATTVVEVPLPEELGVCVNRKPVTLVYRRRSHVIGYFQRNLIRDEYGETRAAGVRAPVSMPTITNGTFASGSTGLMIGYQTFVVKAGGKKIAESNPGPATGTLTSTGKGRIWGSLDWNPQDSHVTHTRGYLSVDGEIPGLVWERPIATNKDVTENVLTAAIGEPLPVRLAADGTVMLDRYARGVPPYTKFAEKYHDAFFYAGDPQHPERIYPSKLYEPEAVNSTPITVYGRTEYPWLTTTDGMPVTGIKRQGEDLVVGTLKGIDVIQGYTHGDYTIRRVSDYWGVLSHFSMCRCGPLSSLFFAAPQGPTIYNAGAFKFIGEPIETWWRDAYRSNPEPFLNSYGAEDRYWRSWKLLLPQFLSSYSHYLVVDYLAAEAGEPIWVMDRRDRNDQCLGELLTMTESNFYELYTGSCDGMVRAENDESDPDDDGDTYLKKMTVRTAHRYVAGDEGDDSHGRTFNGLDLFLKHNNNSITISLYGGDDDASSAVTPQWTHASPATAAPTGSRPLVEKTSERHTPIGVSGKGVTLKIEVPSPVGIEWRGWSVDHIPGPQTRPFKT